VYVTGKWYFYDDCQRTWVEYTLPLDDGLLRPKTCQHFPSERSIYTPWPLKPPVRRPLNIYSTNIRTEYFKHAA
jgi:hypothetical protein